MAELKNRRREDTDLIAPNAEGNIWPNQSCPVFTQRQSAVPGLDQCWYCCYADFHLDKPKALEVGICYWPKKVMT